MRKEREKLLRDTQSMRRSRTNLQQSRNFEKTRLLQEQARRSTMRVSSAAHPSSAAGM